MTENDSWLLALWLLICTLVGGLSYLNPTHYVSPDSTYYLATTGWLVGVAGDTYGHTATGWDSTFPVGYPLLIGAVAQLTGTSVLVASKVLAMLLTGGFLLIWRQRIGARRAIWMGSVFLLGGFLRILTYTWSEGAFLMVLLEWIWLMSQPTEGIPEQRPHLRYVGKLFMLTMALFLLRYVGGYVLIVYGLLTLGTYRKQGLTNARQRSGPDLLYLGLSAGCMLGYFLLNWLLTSSAYGGERFVTSPEPASDTLSILALSLVNELLLLRDYVPDGSVLLVVVGVVLQVILFRWGWLRLKQQRHTLPNWLPTDQQLLRVLLWSAGTYLVVLFALRFFSPFSGPNARLMAPASLPLLMGTAYWVSRWTNVRARRQLGYCWAALLLCSWLQLLPQADFWKKMTVLFGTTRW
ncbi:hypothetical protein A6C57_21675 [Fibrella sp. ES10-3-2-2]|nr:hypothetical protein A6C57_21675 [Fibrella sp. ES10-3-2-2]